MQVLAMTQDLDLSGASVDCRHPGKPGPKAAAMLTDEVGRRTGLELKVGDKTPTIVLDVADDGGPDEGYHIASSPSGVRVTGSDPRGMLFGTGRLLRLLRYGEGSLAIRPDVSITSSPDFFMRGHQLGFRRRSNTYDSWGLDEYEQYIRELIVWGANSIELIPPMTSSDVINRFEFGRKAWDMTVGLSELLDQYDLDVSLWMAVNDRVLPGMVVGNHKDGDRLCPSRPDDRKWMLKIRRDLFSEMRRVNGVFIPGGDPGGCECSKCSPWGKTLIPLAADIGGVLEECHPGAKIWLSNQMFTKAESEHLYSYIEEEEPEWLGGLVYSPWVPETVEEVRGRLPQRYPLRNYPDICHSVRCQYPVDDWDPAYGLVEGRETPNQRPAAFHHIHRRFSGHFQGSITYSDGVNDDVNKIICSALDWDRGADLGEVLLDYARFFFGDDLAEDAARGILDLEANWRGELGKNESVEKTLREWRDLEARAGKRLSNWRFQMHLLRAYLDAYIRRKLLADLGQEEEAMGFLRMALDDGSFMKSAAEVLSRTTGDMELRARIEELARDLNHSIGMKLGREYGAHPERADILDHLNEPLNNSEWLVPEIEGLIDSPPEGRADGIMRILNWDDPGEGGFYDDLGNPGHQPHLVRRASWEDDPGGLIRSSQELDFRRVKGGRLSWRRQAQSLWGRPIEMHYRGLDPGASYTLRLTYGGYRHRARLRLDTAGGLEIHPPLELPAISTQFEYPIPGEATEGGELNLIWSMVRDEESPKVERGIAVAEAWLIKSS